MSRLLEATNLENEEVVCFKLTSPLGNPISLVFGVGDGCRAVEFYEPGLKGAGYFQTPRVAGLKCPVWLGRPSALMEGCALHRSGAATM